MRLSLMKRPSFETMPIEVYGGYWSTHACHAALSLVSLVHWLVHASGLVGVSLPGISDTLTVAWRN